MAEEATPPYRVKIDRGRCVGSGHCVYTQPEVFTQSDDDGLVALLTEHPTEAQLPSVIEAVNVCPARVIRLVRLAEG